MPVDDFATPREWREDLDSRWPERVPMRSSVINLLMRHLDDAQRPQRILELGVGDGEVFARLTPRYPEARFVAVDHNDSLTGFVTERLQGNVDLTCVVQDLSDSSWSEAIGDGFDVIYSMQSFHDFGGIDSLRAVYRQIMNRLKPGGLMINADFVEPMPHDDPETPRRFPFEAHEKILEQLPATGILLADTHGSLGCIVASRPS